jgi:hypothetical protein
MTTGCRVAAQIALWVLVATAATFPLIGLVGAAGGDVGSIGEQTFVEGLVVGFVAMWVLMAWAVVVLFRSDSFVAEGRGLWLVLVLVTGPIAATILLFRAFRRR